MRRERREQEMVARKDAHFSMEGRGEWVAAPSSFRTQEMTRLSKSLRSC